MNNKPFIFKQLCRCICVALLFAGTAQAAAGRYRESGPFCGVNCLFAASIYLGKPVVLESLMRTKYVGSAEFGSSVGELCVAAADKQINALPIAGLTVEGLVQLQAPAILHTKQSPRSTTFDHFVLYIGEQDGAAVIYDAPKPPRRVPLYNLRDHWDGTAIILSVDGKSAAPKLWRQQCRRLLPWLVTAMGFVVALELSPRLPRSVAAFSTFFLHRAAGASTVLVIGGAGGVLMNSLRVDGILRDHAVSSATGELSFAKPFREIGQDKVDGLLRAGTATFIDARFPADYNSSHIRGAINIPPFYSTGDRVDALRTVTRDSTLVVYCQSSQCPLSDRLATELAYDGFNQVLVFRGGWRDWSSRQ